MSSMEATSGHRGQGRGGDGRGSQRGGRGRAGRGRGRGRAGSTGGDSAGTAASAKTTATENATRGQSGAARGRGRGVRGRKAGRSEPKSLTAAAAPTPTPTPARTQQSVEEAVRLQAQQLHAKEQSEAEEKRKEEEERGAKEAEVASAAAEEARLQKLRQARDVLTAANDSAKQHKTYREAMEPAALAQARKDFEQNKSKLKTDVKKCTAFVKKIKTGSAFALTPADLAHEVAALNLSRYVEEVVQAFLETKSKAADIPLILALCVAMHERYEEFLPSLVSALWKVINGKSSPQTAKLRRLYLRLLTEFLLCGILTDVKPLVKCIAEATGGKDGSYAVQDANLVVAFARSASVEILGITPTSIQVAVATATEQWEQSLKDSSADKSSLAVFMTDVHDLAGSVVSALSERAVSPDLTQIFVAHCQGAYRTLYDSLVQTHSKLQKLERRCEQDRLLSGTLSEAREKGLLDARKLKESLERSVETLSDVIDEKMPELLEDRGDEDQGGGGLEVWTKSGREDDNDLGPFDDEETKSFYFDLPDLLTTVPPALLGMTFEKIEARKAENLKKYGLDEIDYADPAVAGAAAEPSLASGEDLSAEATEVEDTHGISAGQDKNAPHYRLNVLLDEELPESNSREQIDEISEKFCTNHGSTRASRKRLARSLFLVPRNRIDLLPFYARLTATLDRVWPDIAAAIVPELEQQFHGLAKFKKNQNVDARIRTCRYIGELTKFRVAPPIVFLRCLRRCLDDFTGLNVDVACCLLETAGRFLHRLPHTSSRITALMESMERLGKAKNLDERLTSLIKAAFYSVNPPLKVQKKTVKVYSTLEAYLRHLLLVELDVSGQNVSLIVKQLARLPWSNPEHQCGELVCKILLKACRNGHYKVIHAVASVLASLRMQKSTHEILVRLVDSVLEELRWALEHPDFRDQQRTITYARLLGELYCFALVGVQLAFEQLYDFINIGHEIPDTLRMASREMVAPTEGGASLEEETPVFRSVMGVSQTIREDEELAQVDLEKVPQKVTVDPVAVSQFSRYDPRVPSATDPPNSAYRIKLVCTVLEVGATALVSRNNLPNMKEFHTAFQRYLFTKTMLPVDVECSLLDTFDVLDSQWRRLHTPAQLQTADEAQAKQGFPRYLSWSEAHDATIAFEEAQRLAEHRRRNSLDRIGLDAKLLGEHETSFDALSINDDSTTLHGEDDDDEHDSASLSVSGKESVTDLDRGGDFDIESDAGDDHDEESSHSDDSAEIESDESESNSDTEDEDVIEEEEEFDEEAYKRQLEDEAFERELRRVTKEALEKGKHASRKQVADYMPSGSHTLKKKVAETTDPTATSAAAGPSFGFDGRGVSLQLLRRGNKGKLEARELVVPEETNLAKTVSRHDGAAARERDEIKQKVLQYEADSAEAAHAGGNVYLEQDRLQVIRNRPLSMEDIDKNFGTSGGNLRQFQDKSKPPPSGNHGDAHHGSERTASRGGRGRGRGRGRGNSSGRTLV